MMIPRKRTAKTEFESPPSNLSFGKPPPSLKTPKNEPSANLSSTTRRSFTSNSRNMTVGLSDEELMNMDIKDLNDFLRRLPKDLANQARRRRRLLKNRGYAQSTRTKRLTTIDEYTTRKMELKDEIAGIKREIERLRGKRENLRLTRARMERMQAAVTNAGTSTAQEMFVKTEPMDDAN